MTSCFICGNSLPKPVFVSEGVSSVTSLCVVIQGSTVVRRCAECGHVQTDPLPDLTTYYDQDYRILVASEDEDQLLVLPDGTNVFRTVHQAATLEARVELKPGALVLDYGCAKSSTLRRLLERRKDIQPHVFDVSAIYKPFWDKFVPEDSQAVHDLPDSWQGRFDLVTSFFALEHVEQPREFVRSVHGLLKAGGCLYGIVPNVYSNIADIIVADHVNHFSAPSLRRLLGDAGFTVREIDGESHPGAWIFVAEKVEDASQENVGDELATDARSVREMSAYWGDFGTRVRQFESSVAAGRPAAIYGSGFYGTWIHTCLRDTSVVRCFVDQNPHRQSQSLLGLPIYSPAGIPDDVRVLYVGLNPRSARAILGSVGELAIHGLDCFYP